MRFIEDTLDYFLQISNYSIHCMALPTSLIDCAKFWGVLYLIGAALAFVVFILTARFLIIERLDFIRYLKKKADREKVADPDVMNAYKWKGDA